MAPLTAATRRRLGEQLLEAAFTGSHREVDRLLNEGADIEFVDREGYSPLSQAAIAGHTPVCGQLLRALADPNHAAKDGRAPLHRAAFHGWVNAVDLLLNSAADPSLKDEDGKTPADLAGREKVRELLADFPPSRTRELLEEWEKKVAALPPRPEREIVEDEVENVPAGKESDGASVGRRLEGACATTAAAVPSAAKQMPFSPPTRGAGKPKGARLTKQQRERRYREAMAELIAESGDIGTVEQIAASLPNLVARIEVMGAGEERLNGIYTASHLARDRVEFEKDDDPLCQVSWSDWQSEWQMTIGDYKLGSNLYRHTHKPNLKADECHGVPEQGWAKWFGKDPEPLVLHLPPEKDSIVPAEAADAEPSGQSDVAVSTTAPAAAESAVSLGPNEAEAAVSAASAAVVEGTEASPNAPALSSRQVQRRTEFIELHPRLKIIKTDDEGAAKRAEQFTSQGQSVRGEKVQVSLVSGGERIVETADGLFGTDEAEEEVDVPLRSEGGCEAHARHWLREDVGDAPEVPATWEAVQAVKATANDLYKEGKAADARQATTAGIRALRKLANQLAALPLDVRQGRVPPNSAGESDEEGEESSDEEKKQEAASSAPPGEATVPVRFPTDEEIGQLVGVLHSNRSLLLLQQIQEGNQDVLAFGAEAAWRLVVEDADVALRANPANFKASFRRAQALFELGELDEALTDATGVVDHYARNSATPNPEAAALREGIMNAIRKERSKFGERRNSRWNRAKGDNLVTEVRSSTDETDWAATSSRAAAIATRVASTTGSANVNGGRNLESKGERPLPSPKTGADVEKALLVTLKGDAARRTAYVKEHLAAVDMRRILRLAMGPDLLGALVSAIADFAAGDPAGAAARLEVLAASPSVSTYAAMFDDKEQAALQRLLECVGPEAAAVWAPLKPAGDAAAAAA
eukprot:TRINITY_DN56098_c0_g1_i1.p1 TRINITY_DN56098_c0_g1~~TRINITY_DN56098_c0_g1_i1.p1  ORF type:complete len:926 (+),score=240.92 TRINITY_DN56098_c0_g1_i1:85-2862(+)